MAQNHPGAPMACSSRQNARLLSGKMQVRVLPCQPSSHDWSTGSRCFIANLPLVQTQSSRDRDISSNGGLVQSIERPACNRKARGLSPRSSTKQRDGSLRDRALDCRSSRCGFEPHASRQLMIRSANGQAARPSTSKCEFNSRPDYLKTSSSVGRAHA